MAIIYAADLRPSKLDLLAAWLPTQPWFALRDTARLEHVGAYRFDDPDGEVGIESHILRHGEEHLHVPLTYRGAPLEGATEWLAGTMEHSVLGDRWVYNACADPAYVRMLAATLLGGLSQATEYDGDSPRTLPRTVHMVAGGPAAGQEPGTGQQPGSGQEPGTGQQPGSGQEPAESCAFPTSSGSTTTISTGTVDLTVFHVLAPATSTEADGGAPWELTGTWKGQDRPLVLATAARRV